MNPKSPSASPASTFEGLTEAVTIEYFSKAAYFLQKGLPDCKSSTI